MKYLRKEPYLLLSFLPLLIVFTYFIAQSLHAPYSDYAGYYFGSKEILKGNYLAAYDPGALNILIESKGVKGVFVAYTPFPPFTAVVFSPFLLFSITVSKLVFNIFSCLFFIISLMRLSKALKLRSWIIAILPLLLYIPIKNNILFGQAYLLLFSLLTEGYLGFIKKKIIPATIFWGIAILFKLFPGFIILYLLIKKQYRYAGSLVVFSVLLFLNSMFICGYNSWKFYLADIIPRLGKGELNNTFTPLFQSMFMLLKNLFVHDTLFNPNSAYNNQYAFFALLTAFQAIILTAVILVSLKLKKDYHDLGIWLLASILLSPNGSSYSLLIVAIPLLLYSAIISTRKIILFSILLFLISNLPIDVFSVTQQTILKFPRLFLILIFFYCLYRVTNPTFNLKYLGIVLLLFTVSNRNYLKTDADKSAYLLSKTPNIITRFSITNNLLTYEQLNIDGRKEVDSVVSFTHITQKGVYVSNNQVFLGQRQITSSPDWKKSPIMADSNIIYLSDKNRGPGFYTLRVLSLKEHPISER